MSYTIKVELPFDMANKDDRELFNALQDGMETELDVYIKQLLREALKINTRLYEQHCHSYNAGKEAVMARLRAQPAPDFEEADE